MVPAIGAYRVFVSCAREQRTLLGIQLAAYSSRAVLYLTGRSVHTLASLPVRYAICIYTQAVSQKGGAALHSHPSLPGTPYIYPGRISQGGAAAVSSGGTTRKSFDRSATTAWSGAPPLPLPTSAQACGAPLCLPNPRCWLSPPSLLARLVPLAEQNRICYACVHYRRWNMIQTYTHPQHLQSMFRACRLR